MDGHQVSPQDARNAWFPASSFPRSSQQADWRLQSPSLGFTGIQGQRRWADKTYHIHSYSRLNLSMSSRKSTETNEVVEHFFLQFHARSSGIGKGFEPTYTFQDRSERPCLRRQAGKDPEAKRRWGSGCRDAGLFGLIFMGHSRNWNSPKAAAKPGNFGMPIWGRWPVNFFIWGLAMMATGGNKK